MVCDTHLEPNSATVAFSVHLYVHTHVCLKSALLSEVTNKASELGGEAVVEKSKTSVLYFKDKEGRFDLCIFTLTHCFYLFGFFVVVIIFGSYCYLQSISDYGRQ